MYLFDVQPFLDLIRGTETPVTRWARANAIPDRLAYVSTVVLGLAENAIEDRPARDRALWRPRLVEAKTAFQARTFDFDPRDAEEWARLLSLGLEEQPGTDPSGQGGSPVERWPVDGAVLMVPAQALVRRYRFVTRRRPWHDVLVRDHSLHLVDPYAVPPA